ncbi:MAG TPA: D-2-hydroxyacid dehydrogenase [Steroidobacteraceae bacterium]|nr:D-2-hydroxyacid dehydrogenase [Steroidobacteraceae bacterium]
MTKRIVFIGQPEVDAKRFETRALADFPRLDLIATNDRDLALRHAHEADVLMGHHFLFDEEMLRRATRLRWIQSLTAGTDGILKLAALRAEVTVTSTRGMHGPQVSELVFLQMLSLLRDFPRMLRNQSAQLWERWPQPLLWGKTIVIVGVGAIAEALAPRCKAFGMTVYGISGSPRRPEGFDGVFGRDEIRRGAALADFLVLIVPHTPQTEKLIDAAVIAAMKPSAYLINVARGGVLDEDALLEALRAGRLAGAALDVFREGSLPAHHPLWRENRVIITPHIGGMSDIYLDQAYPIVRDNLRKFLAGEIAAMNNIVPH